MLDEKLIKKRMIDKGLNQTQLAERIGIATITFVRRLKGNNEWKLLDAYKMILILGCSLEDLMTEEKLNTIKKEMRK